jgi:hypothetical protein
MSRVYVASSWRNTLQPQVVAVLRKYGHEVYDFKNPHDRAGFGWEQIRPDWHDLSTADTMELLKHPIADAGFSADMTALRAAHAVVLVQPCGRSAHLELGWAVGAGKRSIVLLYPGEPPDLMYKMCDFIVDDIDAMLKVLRHPAVSV